MNCSGFVVVADHLWHFATVVTTLISRDDFFTTCHDFRDKTATSSLTFEFVVRILIWPFEDFMQFTYSTTFEQHATAENFLHDLRIQTEKSFLCSKLFFRETNEVKLLRTWCRRQPLHAIDCARNCRSLRLWRSGEMERRERTSAHRATRI